jgi:hypothetical protein
MTNPARPDLDTELRTYFRPDDDEEDHAELRALMVEAADRIDHLERLVARYTDAVVENEGTAFWINLKPQDALELIRIHMRYGENEPDIGMGWDAVDCLSKEIDKFC